MSPNPPAWRAPGVTSPGEPLNGNRRPRAIRRSHTKRAGRHNYPRGKVHGPLIPTRWRCFLRGIRAPRAAPTRNTDEWTFRPLRFVSRPLFRAPLPYACGQAKRFAPLTASRSPRASLEAFASTRHEGAGNDLRAVTNLVRNNLLRGAMRDTSRPSQRRPSRRTGG